MDNKERNAFIESLYKDMFHMLLSLARLELNEEDAYDLVQQVFKIAVERYDKLSTSKNPKGWLTNTLKNLLRNAKRANSKQQARIVPLANEGYDSDDAAPQGYTAYSTDSYEFELDDLFIRTVGEKSYELYRDVYIVGLSRDDLESKYGISYAACRNRATRTKKKLRSALKKYY